MTTEEELLDEMERTLMRAIPHDNHKGVTLYHYTDAAGFAGILETKKLFATHFRHLNDREELEAGEKVIHDVAENLVLVLETNIERWVVKNFILNHEARPLSQIANVFVASLSKEDDQLSQWRGYGASAAGYAIGINKFRLPAITDDNPNAHLVLHFMECLYDEDDYRASIRHELTGVARGFDRFVKEHKELDPDVFIRKAVSIAQRLIALHVPKYKLGGFREEKEWRIVAIPMRGREREVIKFRASAGGVVPYIPIDLCEDGEQISLTDVVLGPTLDPVSGMNGGRMLLSHYNYNPDLARRSKIPFRG